LETVLFFADPVLLAARDYRKRNGPATILV